VKTKKQTKQSKMAAVNRHAALAAASVALFGYFANRLTETANRLTDGSHCVVKTAKG